nr:hypothetical protein [uncultured Ruminococcus sp.]
MKRIFAFILAVAAIAAVLCACGKSGAVKTTVPSKYDDGYASSYAKSTSTDGDKKVYEFTDDQYKQYTNNHKNSLGADIQKEIGALHESSGDQKSKYGEYAYINEEKKAVIVGVHTDQYDEATAKKESEIAAEYGFKYFQNIKDPVDTISVIYCDANNQDTVFGTFEYTAEK